MKEGAPEEINGIDVTNVPTDKQESYVSGVKSAQRARSTMTAASSELEKERALGGDPHNMAYAREDIKKAQVNEQEGFQWARKRVNEDPDPEVARAEMERALKKEIEEKLS
ncbi:MAG TPA: hypothetical protein VJJ02_05380 [Candidatus Paceibacterota bacterium]